ncbi:hypothetical protein BUALT_Bualt07G0154500 [Buddleja alternifolia]|uniref:OCEL domain-containing protein n=1 Tax=Buddleja alternifolia TaxID=168488 RepID=A0AAV6XLQ2_9LAMI|nr:hypothetical protein BUALT_Bualt07G0154500 [Buddleja alternifolia]
MFGASGKVGRGGGGGGGGGSGGKRNVHAPPISRAATTGRLSMGGGPRGRAAAVTSSPSTSSLQAEESFSLVRENPLNFAMAIKLAPDLVEEIKRVEAEGGTARIKFDANANNTNGNVIRVGDKHFKFTWSREPGDLCDIYEERRSGEDGSGLLVESGGTWRKLNVERELDESTKNHVKMRSEEAERKHKSRKAIILDHQNPNMKNQMKALTAAESTPWRNFKHKKEPPFKKPKSEPPSGGPPKSAYKSSLSTTTLSKGKFSSGSPLSSQPEHRGASASPIGSGNIVKGHTSVPDVAPTKSTNKASSSDKEMHGRLPGNTVSDKSKHNRNTEVKPADLRSLMVSLLLEHQPKGMSKQALEKAVGDAMPNSARQIEPILKQIAIFKAPGRYLLKPGVEMESFKEPPSQSGSSPEINRHQSPASLKLDRLPPQDPSFSMRTAANDEEQDPLNSKLGHTTDTIEKIDILNDSPENSSDKKVPENIERIAGSSDSGSDSDSDSDSDSSDSDSDSGGHSKSKSRSPEGSRSSSESESDASSSSKQASDEEVDIMSDNDDIESNHKSPDSDPVPLKSPVQWRHQDKESVDIGNNEKHDDHVSDIVDIEKDSPENFEADRDAVNIFPDKEGEEPVQEINRSSNHRENQERQVSERKPYSGPESVVNDGFKHGQSGSHERMKEKSKRCSDDKHSDERSHNRKKLKSKKLSQPVIGTINSIFGESPDNSSPARPIQGPDDGAINLMADRTCRGDTNDPNLQLGFNQAIPTEAISDSQQPGPRSFQGIGRGDAPSGEKRPGEYDSLGRVDKYSEKNLQTNVKEFNKDAQSENGLVSERRPIKSSAEGVGIKHATMTDSHNRKSEMQGKLKDNNPSTTGRLPVMNGRGRVLQRELSDLEVGEFREPFNDDTPAPKKQFERRSSFKQLENKRTDSEYWNTDLSREKLFNKITADLGKISPPNSEAVESIPDGPSKKKVPEHDVDDLTRPHQKTTRPLHQHSLQRSGDHIEVGQHNRVPEMSGKGRSAEAGTGSGANLEAYGDTSRKVHVNSTEHQHDTIRGVEKESKKQKPNVVGDSNGRRKDASLTGSNDGSQKRRESSSDENSCSYTKYEKEEPELKGPIKDASQYKEYVKEYQEKYESYCSLNKILESYRDEFSKLGKDLESYKDRDMKRYNDILGQMRSSFRQCGEKSLLEMFHFQKIEGGNSWCCKPVNADVDDIKMRVQ